MFKKKLKFLKLVPGSKKERRSLFLLSGLFVIILVFFIFAELYHVYQNRIYPHISIAETSLGSLANETAKNTLDKKVNFLEQKQIILSNKEKTIKTSLTELGIQLDRERMLSIAYEAGRKGNVLQNILTVIENSILGFEIPLYFKVDEKQIDTFISQELESSSRAPQSSEVIYQDGYFKITPSRDGQGIDSFSLAAQIMECLDNPNQININLPPEIIKKPKIEEQQAIKARNKGNNMLATIPNFIAEDKYWTTDRDTIASFIMFKKVLRPHFKQTGFNPSEDNITTYIYSSLSGIYPEKVDESYQLEMTFNESAIRDYLNSVAPGIEQPAINAVLGFENEKLVILAESHDKRSLNIEESIATIIEKIIARQSPIELIVSREEALISQETIGALGIETLVGKGESNFSRSPRNRRHNIATGASKFNGTVIASGETFSFLTILGPVTAATGYLPELVIKANKTVPEYGGGMCQVSTTAFRGAVNSGFEVIERVSHAYPVSYYSPQGSDATVYIPSPDLKFINNTPAHVLVQTKIVGNILTFEFYGTHDGRRVETIGPITYDRKPDGAMRAKWTQKVYRADGSLLLEKIFLSKYNSPSKYPHPGEEEDEDKDKDKKKKKKH
ncbi:MAG: VanW family protein [Patescibacteria group bacterium]|nr:VanW family protein [Patescibacteria group bacterium]